LGEAQHGDLATKADVSAVKSELSEVEAKLRSVIAEVKTEVAVIKTKISELATKAELSDMRADILRWIVGTIGFQTVVMLGALITLVRIFVK
jgi:hypothetical protein